MKHMKNTCSIRSYVLFGKYCCFLLFGFVVISSFALYFNFTNTEFSKTNQTDVSRHDTRRKSDQYMESVFINLNNNTVNSVSDPPVTSNSQTKRPKHWRDVKMYVYPLSERFHSKLLECVAQPGRIHGPKCWYEQSWGFGRLVENRSVIDGTFIYNQCQFGLEPIIHNKILHSGLVTDNPEEANLFYVPFYASMSCFCQDGDTEERDDYVWNYVKKSKHFLASKPHILSISVVQKDLQGSRQWIAGCDFLGQRPKVEHLKLLIIEGRPEETDLLTLPYPSYIHYSNPNAGPKPGSYRPILILATIGKTMTKFRKLVKAQLETAELSYSGSGQRIVYYDLTIKRHNRTKGLAEIIITLMKNATFCIQPYGDTPTRKSFFDSLLSGCIPVIFEESLPFYPYVQLNHSKFEPQKKDLIHFDYTSFTVQINESDIVAKNISIIDILSNIPNDKIRSMQEMIYHVGRFFQYGTYSDGEDAFTSALQNLLNTFRY